MKNLKIGNSFNLSTPKGNFVLVITNLEYDFSYNDLFIDYNSINLQTGEAKKEQCTLDYLKSILDRYNKSND